MVRLEDALANPNRWPVTQGFASPRLLMTVHDELVFECQEEHLAKFVTLLRAVMESDVKGELRLAVPLGINVETGADWGSLQKYLG